MLYSIIVLHEHVESQINELVWYTHNIRSCVGCRQHVLQFKYLNASLYRNMVYISLWCIKRDLPLSRTPALSLSPTIFNSVARIQHTNLVGPLSFSPSLSLCVCAWGGVFLVRMHIYSIYRSLSHTMYDSLVQARYLGCTHRTHTNSLAHCPKLSHTPLYRLEAPPSLSNAPSTWVTHTHAYLTRTR